MTKINVKLDLKAKKTVEKTADFEGDVPTGTIEITANGEYDVASYANANVNVEDVPAVVEPVTVNPTTSQQVIEPKEGVDGFNKVTVEAVDDSIDSNIAPENIKKDVTILGVTGEYEGESPEVGYYYYEGEDPDTGEIVALAQELFNSYDEDHDYPVYAKNGDGSELDTITVIPTPDFVGHGLSSGCIYISDSSSLTQCENGVYIYNDDGAITAQTLTADTAYLFTDADAPLEETSVGPTYDEVGGDTIVNNNFYSISISSGYEGQTTTLYVNPEDYQSVYATSAEDFDPEDILNTIWPSGNPHYKVMYPGTGDYGELIEGYDIPGSGAVAITFSSDNRYGNADSLDQGYLYHIITDSWGTTTLHRTQLPQTSGSSTTITIGSETYTLTKN